MDHREWRHLHDHAIALHGDDLAGLQQAEQVDAKIITRRVVMEVQQGLLAAGGAQFGGTQRLERHAAFGGPHGVQRAAEFFRQQRGANIIIARVHREHQHAAGLAFHLFEKLDAAHIPFHLARAMAVQQAVQIRQGKLPKYLIGSQPAPPRAAPGKQHPQIGPHRPALDPRC